MSQSDGAEKTSFGQRTEFQMRGKSRAVVMGRLYLFKLPNEIMTKI